MENVSVIPMTNEALQSVDTLFVAFEHPFEDRPGRFERQVDTFGRNMGIVLLSDTWPDAMHDQLRNTSNLVYGLSAPADVSTKLLWPESALYKTAVAQLYEIDERITYRPHMHFLCQLKDESKGHWDFECVLSPEAEIVVPDRGVYKLAEPPTVTFLHKPSVRVTAIMLLDHRSVVSEESLKTWQLQTEQSKELIVVLCGIDPDKTMAAQAAADIVLADQDIPSGDAFNLALRVANGEHIAYWDPAATYAKDRLKTQLDLDVDVSIAVENAGAMLLHTHSQFAGFPERHEASLIFHRRVFEFFGGMYPQLHVGFMRDKFFRAQVQHDISFGMHRSPLVTYSGVEFPHGKAYTQQVANDVFRRRQMRDREFHAWAISTRR